MTSTSGITSTAPIAPATQAAPVSTATANAAAQKLATSQSQTVSISPRIIDDPTAGIITEYLDSTGKIVSQNPSSTVVAYLRAGLTAQGLERHPETAASQAASTGTFA